jgi:TfoX/Sxy family transcriptional regulator of competence genes
MATNSSYLEFVCEQISASGEVTYKRMFGEGMIYVNAKPILLVCNNTVYVKMRDEVKDILANAETGFPYDKAKLHYILDIDNIELCNEVVILLESITPIPVKRKKKTK